MFNGINTPEVEEDTERSALVPAPRPLRMNPCDAFCRVIRMALPFSAARLVEMGGVFGTNVILSGISANARAAGSLITSAQVATVDTSAGALLSVGILASDAFGRSSSGEVGIVYENGIIFSLGLSAIVVPITMTMGDIYRANGQSDAVSNIVSSYYLGYSGAVPAILATAVAKQAALGIDRPFVVLISNAIATALTIGLAHAFSKLPYAQQNDENAAFMLGAANAVSAWVTMIGLTIYQNRSRYFRRFGIARGASIKLNTLISLLKNGLPIAIQIGAELGALMFSTVMTGWTGRNNLEAAQIALQYLLVFVIPIIGASEVASILTSQADGSEDYHAGRSLGNMSIASGLSMMAPMLALSFGVPRYLAAPFIDITDPSNDSIVDAAEALLMINAAGLVFDCIRNVTSGNLRGYKDPVTPLLFALLNMVIIGSALGLVAEGPLDMGAEGIFGARSLGMLLGALMLGIKWYVASENKISQNATASDTTPFASAASLAIADNTDDTEYEHA